MSYESLPFEEDSMPRALASDALIDFHAAFTEDGTHYGAASLLQLANSTLDIRHGRPREETVWEDGLDITPAQKEATFVLAHNWRMLQTTYPTKPFDHIVVMGAHYSSLKLRMQHVADIQAAGYAAEDVDIIALSCFRPIHPKEGVDLVAIETEADLATDLLEEDLHGIFEVDAVSCWDDMPDDPERNIGEHAVAYIGKIGARCVTVLSGSVPSDATRATTMSTLKSLASFLESPTRSLFVTTSLHLPYQAIQIERILGAADHEIVGIKYDGLSDLTMDSPDAKFRMVMQEIGATIKNALMAHSTS